MKKLLILALVLGMVSVANAAIDIELSIEGETDGPGNITEISIPICSYVVIDVHGPEFAVGYDAIIVIAGTGPGAGGEWGDYEMGDTMELCSGYYFEAQGYPYINANAGDMAGVVRWEFMPDYGFGYELGAAAGEGVVEAGEHFRLLYHCCGPESEYVTINLYDKNTGLVEDTVVIHQVPEPMTVALLGLGGLFLLRRRR